jgi:hypothetical protein
MPRRCGIATAITTAIATAIGTAFAGFGAEGRKVVVARVA